jgi:acyl carrier protein
VNERIRSIVAEHGRLAVDIAGLSDDDDLYQAGLTSHASVGVMLAIEIEFDIEFPDHMLKRRTFESVRNIAESVDELLGEPATAPG